MPIILEGARLTNKTELAVALNEHPCIVGPRQERYHSPYISMEWCVFANFPWRRGPINFEPQEEPLALETYATRARPMEFLRHYFLDLRPFPYLNPGVSIPDIRKALWFWVTVIRQIRETDRIHLLSRTAARWAGPRLERGVEKRRSLPGGGLSRPG